MAPQDNLIISLVPARSNTIGCIQLEVDAVSRIVFAGTLVRNLMFLMVAVGASAQSVIGRLR